MAQVLGSKDERQRLHNEEAERGVLGAVLLDFEKTLDFCVERQIEADSFSTRSHRIIFAAMLDMNRAGRPVDVLTLSDKLSSQGKLEEVGGKMFLSQLVEAVPTAAHAEYYIDMVRQSHLLRKIIESAQKAQSRCIASDEDADTILGKVEKDFFEISQRQHGSMMPWQHAVRDTMILIENIRANKKDVSGIATGYKDLDTMLLGLHRGEMVVLAARPSMGKTSLAMNIIENVALGVGGGRPMPVGVFSLEMTREQLIMRMLGSRSRIPTHKIAGGFLTPTNHGLLTQAADVLMKAPIYLDDTGALDIAELRSRARTMKRKYDIELFMIDYLQLLHCSTSSREGRQLETSAISGSIKAMAKELNVPVLVLSQLNRAPEARDGRPRLADLRDSGAIEQDADVVLLLLRPSVYQDADKKAASQEDENLAILTVAKQRNGPTGEVKLVFLDEIMRFENYAATAYSEGEYDSSSAEDLS